MSTGEERITAIVVNHQAIYDVLVEECGAPDRPHLRASFADAFPACREWRFSGALGFGGKVWAHPGSLYVTCYREDETPKRLAMMKRANDRLAALQNGSYET